MFPLRDTVHTRTFPLVTWSLIGINVLVFLFEVSLGPADLQPLLADFGLVPARLVLSGPAAWLTLWTSMFLHGGWFHLISNVWTLHIFGDNVEDHMGPARFLAFYLLAGAVAGGAQVAFDPLSRLPTIGASGAIAGVLGAYFVLFPHGRVLTFIPLGFLPWLIEVPAFVYLGFWFVSQLSSGLVALGAAGGPGSFEGIAWWAHIGGFAVGLLLVGAIARRRPRRLAGDGSFGA